MTREKPIDYSNLSSDEQKQIGRGISSDMSPAAIGRRLDTVNQLNELCRALGNAKIVKKPQAVES